jgi:hypothetical protein
LIITVTSAPGIVFADKLTPSDDSIAAQWTSSPAVEGWENVDETPHDSDTTYNHSSTDAQRNLYVITSGFNNGDKNVLAVVVSGFYKSITSSESVIQYVKAGANEGLGTSRAIGTGGYEYIQDIWETVPVAGGAWTETDVDGVLIGVEADI